MCSGRVSSYCPTSGIHRVNCAIRSILLLFISLPCIELYDVGGFSAPNPVGYTAVCSYLSLISLDSSLPFEDKSCIVLSFWYKVSLHEGI